MKVFLGGTCNGSTWRNDGGFSFTDSQWKSFIEVSKMVKRNGWMVFDHLKNAVIGIINN